MKPDTTQKLTRAESSRTNGAKSSGPRTIEGKQRSAYNRTTHGMRSSRVVLSNESKEIYNDLYSLYVDLFAPHDTYENDCITGMVNARWFIRRLEAATAANIEIAMADTRSQIEKNYQNVTAAHEHAFAFRAMGQMKGCDLLGRYEDRQHRIFDKSYRQLARHRGKQSALPSMSTLREAEDKLPAGNFFPRNRLETELDTQNRTIEPEPVLDPAPEPVPLQRTTPQAIEPDKEEEPRNPNCIYEDEYVYLKPFEDAIRVHPDLGECFIKALREYKSKNDPPLAA
jgi:hypothetical protein